MLMICSMFLAVATYEYVGCYNDRGWGARAIDTRVSIFQFRHELCEAVCTEMEKTHMAVQRTVRTIILYAWIFINRYEINNYLCSRTKSQINVY